MLGKVDVDVEVEAPAPQFNDDDRDDDGDSGETKRIRCLPSAIGRMQGGGSVDERGKRKFFFAPFFFDRGVFDKFRHSFFHFFLLSLSL